MNQPNESNHESSQDNGSSQMQTGRGIALQFAIGFILGGVLILVPLSYLQYFSPDKIQSIHLWGSAVLVLLCGILSAWRGGQFVEVLAKILESSPTP
ncbi:MAG: hypothetical protein MUF49_06845 [Oculatellaceae cyanobacterium Prado106]|jgi:hypothetical protein|nr:hypothetical protein [Oculatellaceae cyanobacterium Prado106]